VNNLERMWAEADYDQRDRYLAALAKAAAAADEEAERQYSRQCRIQAATLVVELMVWGFLAVGIAIATGVMV
jgi:hypothetical protein